jgi:hypothetical protein
MKLKLALVFDCQARAHFINPDHVVSITSQGGTIDDKPVIEIGLSNGRFINVTNIGNTEDEAISNLVAQLQDDAVENVINAKPSERIQG